MKKEQKDGAVREKRVDDVGLDLNPEQLEAVKHEGAPLLIIAGAGTGKTAVITERIVWLIKNKGIRPEEILALTFTERAASEMEERIDKALPLGYSQAWIETFHGFCERILRDHALEIGLDPGFRVVSASEQWLILRKRLFELPLNYFRPLGNPAKFLQALVRVIGSAKDQELSPQKFKELADQKSLKAKGKTEGEEKNILEEEADKWREFTDLYEHYNKVLLDEGGMDFGDLILNTLLLFRKRPSVLKNVRDNFKEVLVDEYQDTNGAQVSLLRLLVPPEKGNISIVGDDDQSIYAWRGSNIANILNFQRWYPAADKIVLTHNYRSHQEILDKAYALIQNNNPLRLEKTAKVNKRLKSAVSNTGSARAVHHYHFSTREKECFFAARKIKELTSEENMAYRDFAVLLRTNAMADEIVPALSLHDIPYHVAEARGLLLRPEIKDIIAYLRLAVNPEDSLSLFRLVSLPLMGVESYYRQDMLRRSRRANISLLELFKKEISVRGDLFEKDGRLTLFLKLLDSHAAKASTILPSRVVLEFLQKSGYLKALLETQEENAEVLPNLNEFLDFVFQYEKNDQDANLVSFVEYLDLFKKSGEGPSQASLPADVDSVRVFTVHGAKGLEFPAVFLLGAASDKYPVRSRRDLLELPEEFSPRQEVDKRQSHILEERRLFYVALTRAKRYLYVTSAEKVNSQKTKRKPSPFIAEAGIETFSSPETDKQQLALPLVSAETPAPSASRLTLPRNLSVSQIETYETCPYKYKLQYLFKIPVPQHHSLTFGIAIHNVLNEIGQRVMSGEELAAPQAVDLLEKHWSFEGYDSKEHEMQQKEKGRELLLDYVNNHPHLLKKMPLKSEYPFRFKAGGYWVNGRIDRIDKADSGKITVTDFKTGKAKDQKTADNDLQLSVYALALEKVLGLTAEILTLSYLQGNVDLQTYRTKEKLKEAEEKVVTTGQAINTEEFSALPEYHKCGFCPFRDICDYSAV